jgi:hypothetical protein
MSDAVECEQVEVGPLDGVECFVVGEIGGVKSMFFGPTTKTACGFWIVESWGAFAEVERFLVMPIDQVHGLRWHESSRGALIDLPAIEAIDKEMLLMENKQLMKAMDGLIEEARVWRALWQATAEQLMRVKQE